MRNIRGWHRTVGWNVCDPRGVFTSQQESQGVAGGSGQNNSVYVKFDANVDTNNYGNNMAGHATGPDIKPYSVKTLYLISY